ncbi:MAG: hypothetical protein JWQ60_417 [Pseudonocardia sp.]|nr:hypothetical protein [Pseudonocardia sp.]
MLLTPLVCPSASLLRIPTQSKATAEHPRRRSARDGGAPLTAERGPVG